MNEPVAVQVNLFPVDQGILVVPFSEYDESNRTSKEIGRFVIPWHQLHDVIGRMERIEQAKLDVDTGNSTF